ncbi:Spy/CpxP family protein refolding chaperone [Pelistega europaea]|uniref:Periplasmic heavy metal sensor n=1 Tax=Pelistega europaea TaxID=106147 RepID=A0A7Y4LBR9_9BURK|nr:Spy/CpxP family protein refolding chaperone [Pelistega europaea]NOL49641.1 hypothetical protein [Pelistega europaea]
MKTTTLKNLLLTSALAFGLAGGAYAQDTSKDAPKAEFSQKMPKHDNRHEGFGLFSPKLIKSLNLTEAQKAKFDEVKDAQQAALNRRETVDRQIREERKSLLSAEIVDLKALLDNGEQFHKEMTEGKVKIREKVLAFWDSLDKDQKIKVTQSLKNKQERMDKFVEQHRKAPKDGDQAKHHHSEQPAVKDGSK